jgi:hypothetical protein
MPVPLVRDVAKSLPSRRPRRLLGIPLRNAFTDRTNAGDGFFGSKPSQRPKLSDRLSIAGNNDRLAGFDAVQHLGKPRLCLRKPDSRIHMTSLTFLVN